MRYDTWYDIKLKTFHKIFGLNNGSTQIPTDMMGADYENAMPGAANEALQLLATAGKFIIKSIDIAHIPVRSLIQNGEKIRSVERGSIAYEAEGVRSMYYECKGKGTMTTIIGSHDPVTTEFDDTDSLGYVPHKMLIPVCENTSDTTFDNNKSVNKVVVGEEVELTVVDYSDFPEWFTGFVVDETYLSIDDESRIFFTATNEGLKLTATLNDGEDLEYRARVLCYHDPDDPSEVPMRYEINTHHLVGVPHYEENATVKVEFTSDYPFSLKNVALYSANYETEDDIPPYSEYVRYDLRELADDFYMVDPEHIIYEGNREVSRYMATSDWFEEGYKVLLLKRNMPGNYKIYYKAYPQPITLTTPDDTELVLDPEVSALLPLYIASQIYKDDDNQIATIYRNEFEVAFERLVKKVEAPSQERFVSVTGWI